MSPRRYLIVAALSAAPALAQQPGAPAKTTEQQARSYVASAFITGAAPVIMSEKVIVSPALRQRLALPPEADGPAVYNAMMNVTGGKQLLVRRAAPDEVAISEAPAAVSEQPVFALDAGSATFILQYDMGRDNISFVGVPTAVAVATPVAAPVPPEQISETPPVAAPAVTMMVAETPVVAPEPPQKTADTPVVVPPAAVEAPKASQVVEPTIPRMIKPAATPVPQPMVPKREPPPPLLKPSGPCAIKPVMSDQDFVNCGATPH